MAENLNEEQQKSIREQMRKRALNYDREASNMLTTGDAENSLVQRRLYQARRLKDIAYGIGVALGEESYNIDFGSGEGEEFNPNLNIFWVPEAEWWRSFRTRVEVKQHMYPGREELQDRPVDDQGRPLKGGHSE